MDPPKVGIHSDAPSSLEKGSFEFQPLHSETYRACPVQSAQIRRRPSFVKHIWIVFGIAALTLLVFSRGWRVPGGPYHAWHLGGDRVGLSLPVEEDLDRCVGSTNWTNYYDQPPWALEYPYGAETTFSLPLDSDALYLLSRGAMQRGQVKIEQSTQVADTVDIHIRVAYHYDEVLEHATVCHMERAEREHGIGIFTPPKAPHSPHHYRPEDQLLFDVTLTLPAGNGGPLLVKALGTDLPNYSQDVADLQESVLFNKIFLKSIVGRLSVQSVTSEVGQFSTVTGEISGHFNARSSLELQTVVGRIAPTVNLLHRQGPDHSNLTMHTVDGAIDAEISLTSETSTGGEFEVDAMTTNGSIRLKFADTPVDSVLRCHAKTVLGNIEAELDSAFEGTFSLQTLLGKRRVSQHDVEDPAGKGRRRVVSQHVASGRVEGEVMWVGSDGRGSGNEGYVTLRANIASVQLTI